MNSFDVFGEQHRGLCKRATGRMVEDEGEKLAVVISHGTLWSMLGSLDFNLSVVED